MRKLSPLFMTAFIGMFLLGCDAAFRAAEFNGTEDEPVLTTDNSGTDATTPGQTAPEGVASAFQLVQGDVNGIIDQIPKCGTVIDGSVIECLIIKDSFERGEIMQTSGPGFDWSRVIYDVIGAQGEQVNAEIYSQDDMGPTPDSIADILPDQNRAVWFSGRPGNSVHSIYLISRKIDVRAYNSVMVGFKYLAADLENWSWNGNSGIENIRLEVCDASLDECGIGQVINETNLNSDAWHTYDVSAAGAGDGLTGHNHGLEDWRDGFANIDLTPLSDTAKENFVFRIAVTVDEGFEIHDGQDPDISSNMLDGVGLDNVIALASTRFVDDSCHPPCEGDDCPCVGDDCPPPVDDVANLELNFGNPLFLGSFPVNSSTNFDLELENKGTASAASIDYSLGGSYAFEGTTCNPIIVPGEVCMVTLSYNPTSASLFDEEIFMIEYDDNTADRATTSKTLQAVATDL